MHTLFQRAVSALALLTLTSCGTQPRQWGCHEIRTHSPQFDSTRLILESDSSMSPLEVVFVKSYSGLRMYINLLKLEAPPHTDNPKRTTIDITFEDEEKITIYPYLLKGGQRILLPMEITEHLIQRLLDGQSFTISLGPREIKIIPANFNDFYKEFRRT